MYRKRARIGSPSSSLTTHGLAYGPSSHWPCRSGYRLGIPGSATLSAARSSDLGCLSKTVMAEKKGNELVATTGGGDSGLEDIFAQLGPLLDSASEIRMNYKKGAASSVFDVTIRDLFRLPRNVRLEISKQRSSKLAPTVSFSKDLAAFENAILKVLRKLALAFSD